MRSSKELTATFFKDLKTYNNTNFKTIARADLSKQDAVVHKSFSSVLTRYFIFKEKHPEVTDEENRVLYFKLKLDMIARYFSEYPDTTPENLVAFQLELKEYIKECQIHARKEVADVKEPSVSDIGLEPDNRVPVEQQQESVSVAI